MGHAICGGPCIENSSVPDGGTARLRSKPGDGPRHRPVRHFTRQTTESELDETLEMTGGEALARMLAAHEIGPMFGMGGFPAPAVLRRRAPAGHRPQPGERRALRRVRGRRLRQGERQGGSMRRDAGPRRAGGRSREMVSDGRGEVARRSGHPGGILAIRTSQGMSRRSRSSGPTPKPAR